MKTIGSIVSGVIGIIALIVICKFWLGDGLYPWQQGWLDHAFAKVPGILKWFEDAAAHIAELFGAD